MAQAGLELTTSCLPERSLSAFCHTDSCFPSVKIRIYKNKALFIYGGRSLLSCCTVVCWYAKNMSTGGPIIDFNDGLKNVNEGGLRFE